MLGAFVCRDSRESWGVVKLVALLHWPFLEVDMLPM